MVGGYYYIRESWEYHTAPVSYTPPPLLQCLRPQQNRNWHPSSIHRQWPLWGACLGIRIWVNLWAWTHVERFRGVSKSHEDMSEVSTTNHQNITAFWVNQQGGQLMIIRQDVLYPMPASCEIFWTPFVAQARDCEATPDPPLVSFPPRTSPGVGATAARSRAGEKPHHVVLPNPSTPPDIISQSPVSSCD